MGFACTSTGMESPLPISDAARIVNLLRDPGDLAGDGVFEDRREDVLHYLAKRAPDVERHLYRMRVESPSPSYPEPLEPPMKFGLTEEFDENTPLNPLPAADHRRRLIDLRSTALDREEVLLRGDRPMLIHLDGQSNRFVGHIKRGALLCGHRVESLLPYFVKCLALDHCRPLFKLCVEQHAAVVEHRCDLDPASELGNDGSQHLQ